MVVNKEAVYKYVVLCATGVQAMASDICSYGQPILVMICRVAFNIVTYSKSWVRLVDSTFCSFIIFFYYTFIIIQ